MIRGPISLASDELVRQNHSYRNAFEVVRQKRLRCGILVHIDHDRRFVIRPAEADAHSHDAWLEHQVRPVVLKHCRHAICSLLRKLGHYTLQSGDERFSVASLVSFRSWGAAATAEAERAAQRGAEFRQHFADWIADRSVAAAGE